MNTERLRELLGAATGGRWLARKAKESDSEGDFSAYLFAEGYGVVGYWNGHKDYHSDCNWLLTESDANLIAELRNAAPALLAAADEVGVLIKVMKEYAEAQGDYDMTLEFYSEESNHKEMRRARGRMQKAAKAYRQALAAHDKDSR